MEINLTLTAKRWQLASQVQRGKPHGGVLLVKNVPERTYLAITPAQWQVLVRFAQPRTVPQALEAIIEERVCPALGEFYELVLKAVRARILVEPGQPAAPRPAVNWVVAVRPTRLRLALWGLLAAGLGFTAALEPELPRSLVDVAAGLGVFAVAWLAGQALAASLVRGAGGEVYVRRGWILQTDDACLLTPSEQRTIAVAPLALLSTATGLLAWQRPEWSLVPLVGLLFWMRPIVGGGINRMIRVGAEHRLSDAEHAFVFPPNRSPRMRWRLLRHGLRNPTTWLEIGYGVLWTLALGYFFGVLTDVPPWKLEFWQANGTRVSQAIFGSLFLLGLFYVGSETFLFLRDRARARRETLRLWWRRWLGRRRQPTDESARLRAVLRSPLLRMLPPPEQQAVASALQPHAVGPWRVIQQPTEPVTHVSLVLSGRVGVYRRLPSGRRVLVQILCEDDLVGLHAVADPEHPEFLYRTLSPVLLLRLERARAEELVLSRLTPPIIANQVQKLPFLSRISLCQNWHVQAIQRFAELSRIADFGTDKTILQSGFYSENFYIMFEGEAKILSKGRVRGVIRGSDFFGEIGLLQNSNATAQVMAGANARCLCIPRREFLRFVAHNYTVALELERVSSQRLGHPIFPLSPDNFRTI
ncbi:MAG: cyclic nucleotide-binding domain-containing protein [Opitutaceae bacterium]|nr:cyclic nucleotide-binding domain-containing protein [Opitutaceae bacterium]